MAGVQIENTSSDLNGAILKNAATEATLQALLSAVKTMDGKSGSGGKGNDSASKTMSLFDRILGEATGTVKDHGEQTKKAGENVKSFGKSVLDTAVNITSAGLGLVLSGITAAGKSALEFFTGSIQSYKEATSVGASFNQSLIDFRKAAAQSNLTLEQFSDVIRKNSSMLSNFGGTVTLGAQRFGQLSKDFIDSDMGTKLQGMGFTVTDLNDSLATYMEMQTKLGKLNGQSNNQLREGTTAYLSELDLLTKATGISRKDAEAAAKKASIDPMINAMRKSLNPEQLARSNANLALMIDAGGQEMQDAIKEVAAGIPTTPLAKSLATIGGVSRETARDMIKGNLTQKETNNILADAGKKANNMVESYGENASAVLKVNDGLAKMYVLGQNEERLRNRNFEAAAKEQNVRNRSTEALTSFSRIFDTVVNNVLAGIMESGTFENFQKTLDSLADQFINVGKLVGPFLKDLISEFDKNLRGGGIVEAISGAFKKLFDTIAPVISEMIKRIFEPKEVTNQRQGLVDQRSSLVQKKQQLQSSMAGTPGDLQGDMSQQIMEYDSQIAELDNKMKELNSTGSNNPFGSITEGLKSFLDQLKEMPVLGTILKFMDGINWAFENFGKVLLIGGGAIAGLTLLAAVLPEVGGALSALLAPVSLLLGAFGLAAGGLGYMFNAVANIIERLNQGFASIPEVIERLANIGGDNIKAVASAMGDLAGALAKLAGGSILSMFTSGGLDKFVKSATDLSLINSDSIRTTVDSIRNISNISSDLDKSASSLKSFIDTGKDGIKLLISSINDLSSVLVKLSSGSILSLFTGKALDNFVNVLKEISSLDSNSIQNTINSLQNLGNINADSIGNLISALSKLSDSGVLSVFTGGGLDNFVKNLKEISSLDSNSIQNTINSLQNLSNLSTVTNAINDLSSALGKLAGGGILSIFTGGGFDNFVKNIKEISSLDSNSIQNTVSAIKNMSTIGQDFDQQAAGIVNFTEAIKELTKRIQDLQTSLKELNKTPGGTQAINNGSATAGIRSAGDTGISPTSTLNDRFEKLNTLMTELVTVTKEIRDHEKDQTDAIKGRNSAMGPR